MFINEVVEKFKIEDVACAFSVLVLGKDCVLIEGVRRLVSIKSEEIKIKVKKKTIVVFGLNLNIVEIGGGNLYIKGEIGGINFEN